MNTILTVDIVVPRFISPVPEIVLVYRSKDPFAGTWALPGGKLDESDKTLEAAALRELEEETGLVVPRLRQIQAFGDLGRDPRPGRWVSIGFLSPFLLNDVPLCPRPGDAITGASWFPINALPPLAFDHLAIVKRAFEVHDGIGVRV